jgi:hypothetical protein
MLQLSLSLLQVSLSLLALACCSVLQLPPLAFREEARAWGEEGVGVWWARRLVL